jgi:hypothetical protein
MELGEVKMKKIFEGSLILIAVLVLFVGLGNLLAASDTAKIKEEKIVKPEPVDVARIKDADYSTYLKYLKQHAKSPAQYVRDKFKDHDVVILGEMHGVKENLKLIRDLIDPLYHRSGVRYFAMELLRHRNTGLANQLVTGKEYDQQLALRIFRDYGHPDFGYKEYMDIIKAIWRLNSRLAPEAEKFKVIALDKGDWESIDLPTSPSPEEYEKFVKEHDPFMADVLAQEVLEKGGKALVQIGYAHSFTRYRLAEMAPRFGYILHEKYGDRIFQICLHQPHFGPEVLKGNPPTTRPDIIDFIEKIMTKNRNKPAAFDMDGSPFESLRDRKSLYFAFQDDVVFSDIAQGYIFIKPLDRLNFRMTWVDGFINEENFERAKAIAQKRGLIEMFEKRGLIKPGQCDSPEGLDKLFKLVHQQR